MQQILLSIAVLSMAAAISEQLLGGGRFFPAIRLVIGMEIASNVISFVADAWNMLNG